MSLSKVYPQLPPSPALTSSPNLIPKKDAQSSSSSMAASQLTDIKLSKYYANNKQNHPTPQKCNFKLEPFYLYTILIFAATIILIISPKLGIVFIKGIIKFTANISTIPEPGRSFMFAGLLYMHQFLAIPLQSVTVMLVTFCTRSFFYGFILTTLINISSSLLVYFLGRKCCYRWLHSKYKENIFVLVIRDEASRNPIKVAFMFRFMNIPGLYKNIGLILSDAINFKWYILPAIMESCISTAFLCILGNVMTHGLDVLDPKAIGNKKKELKTVFILSYFFMGVQILCIFIGIIISVFKYKKMQRVKREVERRRWRESVKTKGYIHDVENHYATQTNEHDIPESLYSNPTHHDGDCPTATLPKEDDKSTIEVFSPLGPKRDQIESSTSSRRSTHNGRTESNIPLFTQESTIVDRIDHNTQCDKPIEMSVPDRLLKELDDSNPSEDK